MIRVIAGDCRTMLATLPAASVQACVCSPPYYGLRKYLPEGHPNAALEIGAEQTPDAYVAALVDVFREVRRALADTGVVFLNLGDSYRDKQLLGIPWRVAFALQADGWVLRSSIVWAKPAPMPESVRDRPTSSYEMVFLLTKNARYFYDAAAIAEPRVDLRDYPSWEQRKAAGEPMRRGDPGVSGYVNRGAGIGGGATRNCRNVWSIAIEPSNLAHFATMPPELAERCIKAGSKPGDTILDPFSGAGTTLLVADRLNRDAIGIELNPDYANLSRDRVTDDAPLFAVIA